MCLLFRFGYKRAQMSIYLHCFISMQKSIVRVTAVCLQQRYTKKESLVFRTAWLWLKNYIFSALFLLRDEADQSNVAVVGFHPSTGCCWSVGRSHVRTFGMGAFRPNGPVNRVPPFGAPRFFSVDEEEPAAAHLPTKMLFLFSVGCCVIIITMIATLRSSVSKYSG